jgi:hypothetical protein
MDRNSRVNTLDGIIAGVNCPTKIYLPKKPAPIENRWFVVIPGNAQNILNQNEASTIREARDSALTSR